MVNSYADDYKKEKEELRRTLVKRSVLGPSEWDFKKQDITTEVEKLPHFTSRDLGDLILFELVEEGISAPIIGKMDYIQYSRQILSQTGAINLRTLTPPSAIS